MQVRFYSVKIDDKRFEGMYIAPTKEEAEDIAISQKHFTREELDSPDFVMTDVTEEEALENDS